MNSVTVTLLEIRFRAAYCAFSCIMCFCVCFRSTAELLYVFGRPVYQLHDRFQFFDTAEAFSTWIVISFLWTCLGVLPLLLYHIWCFTIPSHYDFERHSTSRLFVGVLGLVSVELLLVYGWIFPAVYHFLVSIPSSGDILLSDYSVEFAARLGTYVGFFVKFFTILLLLCQLPVVLGVWCARNGVTGSHLATMRRWVVMILILCSALVSPPDIVSQLAITLWGLVLFEITAVYGCFSECVKREMGLCPDC
jgi:sec-independent protein translocase protein TatC